MTGLTVLFDVLPLGLTLASRNIGSLDGVYRPA